MTSEEIYAVRGATTVSKDFPVDVDEAVKELMEILLGENGLKSEDISFILFSQTSDIRSRNAAGSFRNGLGVSDVPLFCVQEAEVAGMLPHCIRVLVQVNHKRETEPKHIYLRDASMLRPDISGVDSEQ